MTGEPSPCHSGTFTLTEVKSLDGYTVLDAPLSIAATAGDDGTMYLQISEGVSFDEASGV